MNENRIKKFLVVGTAFLFIGVIIAPLINFNIVKASNNNELIDVTTRVYGLNGFKDTILKLTRKQYQNLENYLAGFRTQLDLVKNRKEAIPIFKEAVAEFNKYGLLPKGISIENAESLVTNNNFALLRNPFDIRLRTFIEPISESENHFCLIAGETTETWFEGPMTIFSTNLLSALISLFPNPEILVMLYLVVFILLTEFSARNPLAILYRISFGGLYVEHEYPPTEIYASGWVDTLGINGRRTWHGEMQGALPINGAVIPGGPIAYTELYPGAVGFTGIKISPIGGKAFYLGSALWVRIVG